MKGLFRFSGAVRHDPAVTAWMHEQSGDLGAIAEDWFDALRSCGSDVRELLHDGHPTACVGDVAFAYVNAFARHVNVGFFRGADLPDPHGLLEGTGRSMRHVKVRPAKPFDASALQRLIRAAYDDMKRCIEDERTGKAP